MSSGGTVPRGGATSLTDKELSMRKFVDNQARSMKSNELESLIKHMAQEDLDDERAAEPPNAARIAVAQAELGRCKKDLRDFYRKRTDI